MISLEAAQSILAPYHKDLSWCVTQAWQRWRMGFAPQVPLVYPRGRANMMYELMIDEARKRFEGVKGIALVENPGRILINIKDQALIRFKKFDDRLQTHNYPTLFSLSFDAQADLPGFSSKLPRITVGYRLNLLQTDIEKPLVVFSVENNVQWAYELEKPKAVEVFRFPISGDSPASVPARARLKQDVEQNKQQGAKVIPFNKPK